MNLIRLSINPLFNGFVSDYINDNTKSAALKDSSTVGDIKKQYRIAKT
jgi:hypothetical protein